MRSSHLSSIARTVTVLPFSSAMTAGCPFTPLMPSVVICSSGNARPMRSQSTTGMRRVAARMNGMVEFTPPASTA